MSVLDLQRMLHYTYISYMNNIPKVSISLLKFDEPIGKLARPCILHATISLILKNQYNPFLMYFETDSDVNETGNQTWP